MLWLIIGMILGAFFFWLVTSSSIKLTWYEWVLAVLAVVIALFAIQNYTASVVELEPRAAGILLAMFGVPALVIAGVDVFLVWRHNQSAPVK